MEKERETVEKEKLYFEDCVKRDIERKEWLDNVAFVFLRRCIILTLKIA
jgi:hypothetical protein